MHISRINPTPKKKTQHRASPQDIQLRSRSGAWRACVIYLLILRLLTPRDEGVGLRQLSKAVGGGGLNLHGLVPPQAAASTQRKTLRKNICPERVFVAALLFLLDYSCVTTKTSGRCPVQLLGGGSCCCQS